SYALSVPPVIPTLVPLTVFFFFYLPLLHCSLHSFPTRRSSDLFISFSYLWGPTGRNGPPFLRTDPSVANRKLPRLRRRQSTLARSEEHTSELQSLRHLVCRLLLEKKK